MKKRPLIILMIVLISMHNIMAMKKEEPKQEIRISQPDGKTLIFIQGDEPHTWEVLRFDPDNSPDSSFGFNGKMAHMGNELESILTPIAAEIESDGNILLTYSEKDKKGSESFFQSRILVDTYSLNEELYQYLCVPKKFPNHLKINCKHHAHCGKCN